MRRVSMLVVCLLVGGLMLGAPAGSAQETQPSLTVTPGDIALAPVDSAKVLLTISNPAKGTTLTGTVSALDAGGLAVTFGDKPTIDIVVEPGRRSDVVATVSRVANQPVAGGIVFRLQPTTVESHSAMSALLKVAVKAAEASAKLVDVAVESSLADLNELRKGTVYVVVTNLTTENVTASIAARVPADMNVVAVTAGDPDASECGDDVGNAAVFPKQEISVGSSNAFAFRVCPGDQVTPGKKLTLFDVDAMSGGTPTRTASVVKTLTLQASVFGESELLTALGLPSFLFLPGFLVLVAFRLIRASFGWPKHEHMPWSEAKSADFALVAITLSIVAALVYPLLTDLIGPKRSYLNGYSIKDIVAVWAGAIIVGIALSVAWRAVENAAAKVKARAVPTVAGGPDDLLTFIAREKSQVLFPQVTLVGGNRQWLLVHGSFAGKEVWVAPTIKVRVDAGAPADAFDAAIATNRPKEVKRLLDDYRARTPPLAQIVDWNSGDQIRHFAKEEFSALQEMQGPPRNFVERV